jgi:hypothetical protein
MTSTISCRPLSQPPATACSPAAKDLSRVSASLPPKRAKNAYLVFLARHEPEVAEQHQGWSRNQVMNVVAAMWKKVPPEEKVPIHALQPPLKLVISITVMFIADSF